MKRPFTPTKALAFLLGSFTLCTAASAQMKEPELTETERLEQRVSTLEDGVRVLQKLKVSGYLQAQYQWGEQDASLKVGGINTHPGKSFDRIGIRRGRIKFAYEDGLFSGVFQIDLTEKGLGLKDAYLIVKDPWVGTNLLKAGVFDRPFGYEISYSSSRRESPERSTVFQTLFPEERDLGGAIILQPSKTSPWNILKFEGGFFAGNGIKPETDNRKDFIGHLSLNKPIGGDAKFGIGASYYNGSVVQLNRNVYTMDGKSFVLNDDDSNKGAYAKREYFGFDAQFSVMSPLGLTQLRGEYLFGTQPGGPAGSKSPNYSSLVFLEATASNFKTADTYIRNFAGGYAMLVQDLGRSSFSAVAKYDWYDPNTKLSGNEIGVDGSNTTLADLTHNTWGFGLLWRASNAIRVTAYYELNRNEKTINLPNFTNDVKNDVFTLRVQYKF